MCTVISVYLDHVWNMFGKITKRRSDPGKNFIKVLEMEGKEQNINLLDSCRKSCGAGKPGQWKTTLLRAVIRVQTERTVREEIEISCQGESEPPC